MAIANGAQHSLHYVAEATYGTTPTTPTWTPVPHTGTSLAMTKDAIESEVTLNNDRDYRQVRKLHIDTSNITDTIYIALEFEMNCKIL